MMENSSPHGLAATATYAGLEAAFTNWAAGQSGVQALLLIGSRARESPPADEWSDLDLIALVLEAKQYLSDAHWLEQFGSLWLLFRQKTGHGDPEIQAIYAGGTKVDIVWVQVEPGLPLRTWLAGSPYPFVFQRGLRTLVDKTSSAGIPWNLPALPDARPSAEEFGRRHDHFWLGAMRAAKFLRRGETWQAKQQIDCALKSDLLSLLEWQAACRDHSGENPWYEGRYLNEWGDPRALSILPAAFGAYQIKDLWRALRMTLSLFQHLAEEIAGHLGYSLPDGTNRQVIQWILSLEP